MLSSQRIWGGLVVRPLEAVPNDLNPAVCQSSRLFLARSPYTGMLKCGGTPFVTNPCGWPNGGCDTEGEQRLSLRGETKANTCGDPSPTSWILCEC